MSKDTLWLCWILLLLIINNAKICCNWQDWKDSKMPTKLSTLMLWSLLVLRRRNSTISLVENLRILRDKLNKICWKWGNKKNKYCFTRVSSMNWNYGWRICWTPIVNITLIWRNLQLLYHTRKCLGLYMGSKMLKLIMLIWGPAKSVKSMGIKMIMITMIIMRIKSINRNMKKQMVKNPEKKFFDLFNTFKYYVFLLFLKS